MSASFGIQPIGRFAGGSQPVKRPKEFACFSYDENHQFHLDDSSIQYYYPPVLGADLSKGFETFQKQDDSKDEHLDSLLKTIIDHEQKEGKKIDANVVTWRGMITKIMATPFETRDGKILTDEKCYNKGCLFIEESHKHKMESRANEKGPAKRRGPPLEVMQFWGYKFETLATLPKTWAETSREYIEERENHVVNNKAQYCSVVRTGIGKTVMCLGGEVDAIWDSKPLIQGSPTNWVELKTSAEIRGPQDRDYFHRKLMKFWIQSFLLGVPKIIVGFRTRDGILSSVDEIETQSIPQIVNSQPNPSWNADMCVNFAGIFLEWLTQNINDEGVWRISRKPQSPIIEVYRVQDTGHGDILSEEFKNWRIKLAMKQQDEQLEG
ncbi:unnamed protein product [Clonostachys rhizophaga]|uniref:Decapping nuclease n=1 Tax=Clonostachys rhizophaga TaxID=160324 RepID=A0A9N9YPF8_9HYPO|nr:unnamed protein product [Clonostachys rhizophaga]